MARITVEECLKRVPNRFRLVVLSSQRARELAAGAPSLILETEKSRNAKYPVVSLREIETGYVDPTLLETAVVQRLQRFAIHDAQATSEEEQVMEALLETEEFIHSHSKGIAMPRPVGEEEDDDFEEDDDLGEEDLKVDAEEDEDFDFDEDNLDVED